MVFMTELVLDRAICTPGLIQTLLTENQKRLLLSLITKPIRPLYKQPAYSTLRKYSNKGLERELHFVDIVETALHFKHKSTVVIELIKLLQN